MPDRVTNTIQLLQGRTYRLMMKIRNEPLTGLKRAVNMKIQGKVLKPILFLFLVIAI